MRAFSHSKKNKGRKREGSKYLIDHLEGVRDKAIHNFSENLSFSTSDKVLWRLIDSVCWLHDLGKYTSYFQTYLIEPEKAEWYLKAHSNLGAHVAFQLHKDDPENALLAFYLIKMHHSNLLNFDKVLRPDNYSTRIKFEEQDIFDKQVESLGDHSELKDKFPGLNKKLFHLSKAKELKAVFKDTFKNNSSIETYFKINYLFSLLIESDKLDASDTKLYELTSLPESAVDERPKFGKPNYPEGELKTFSQNELRNFVRAKVVENLNGKNILRRRIFTLAAPTGIGKTMTALDFVLKLRKKIEKKEQHLPQIIYGLPFINIIEQALEEYERTLKDGKIIGHYQFADIFGSDSSNKNHINDEEYFYSQKKMAWDTWQGDVVITSFVQLFETLIGNRNKLLKKFHHLANSIIILDEVQTLPIEKLPLIGASLYFLCKYLDARVLIMTATQPKIFELMKRELNIEIDDTNLSPLNLLKRDEEVFACFNRTKIIPKIDKEIDVDEFAKLFDSHWVQDKSCLIVVNKVSRSIELYNRICELKKKQGFDNPVLYLSTNITPRDRRKRVNWLKSKLKSGTNPVLISTQVVEAGVDLDFDMGFRDIGPIDSIIQVAGRINRENSDARMGSPLYVVNFGDCQKIYGFVTYAKSHLALDAKEIPESDYKKMVELYFKSVSDPKLSDFSTSTNIFDAMKNLRYAYPNSSKKNKKTVSDFKIIEKSHEGVSIYVEMPNDRKGRQARKAYQLLLEDKAEKHIFDRKYKKVFHQRIIAVPAYLENVDVLKLGNTLTEDLLWIKPEEANSYYDLHTGFIRKQKKPDSVMMF